MKKKPSEKWNISVEVPADWDINAFAGSLKGFFPKITVIKIDEQEET